MATDLLVPDTFGEWLRSSRRRLAIPPLTLGVPAILTALNWLRTLGNWPWLRPTLVGLQLLTIIALVLLLPHPLVDKKNSPRATIAAEQFSHWWRLLWLFWLTEYVVLVGREIISVLHGQVFPPWAEALGATSLNLANNLPTIALVMCYYIISVKTIWEVDGGIEPRRVPWEKPAAILVLLVIVEFALRLNASMHPEPISQIAVGAPEVFDWTSGICAGLATALLAGRLDSRFIRLSPLIVTFLYVYAVIQAAWPTFSKDPDARIVIVNIALTLKILLFAVVYWMFKSGVFLYYLDRIAAVYEYGPAEKRDFVARVQRNLKVA